MHCVTLKPWPRWWWLFSLLAFVRLGAAQPAVPALPKPDLTVAADGTGDFQTVQQALAAVPRANRDRVVIFIKDGVYREKVRVEAPFVTLRGQSRAGTRIEFPQLNDDFTRQPDALGRAVVNIVGDDCVIENLTVANTAGVIGPHAFAVYGTGDRTVIMDSDILSQGADTLSLWKGASGRYYHARLNIRGSVDFVCPRGWCYMTDCSFFEVNPGAEAAIWHDGSKNQDMKFVLRHCRFDGVEGWRLERHHHDAQYYLVDCTFSKALRDAAPHRVVYPLGGREATAEDLRRNAEMDRNVRWGLRCYFFNCRRDGGNYPWMQDNLATAPGAPAPEKITAAWTFAGTWDPERTAGPTLTKIEPAADGQIAVTFSENVTVKGQPRLLLATGVPAVYVSGSGSDRLVFQTTPGARGEVTAVDLNGGAILATEAYATLRSADLALPATK